MLRGKLRYTKEVRDAPFTLEFDGIKIHLTEDEVR